MRYEMQGYFHRTARRPAVEARDATSAFKDWLQRNLPHLDKDLLDEGDKRHPGLVEQRLLACNANAEAFSFDLFEAPPALEKRAALSVQVGPSGGYLRRPGLVASFEAAMQFFSAVRQCASVERTEDGAPYCVATINDTANEGAIVGENAAPSSPNAVPLIGLRTLSDFKFTSGELRVPQELLNDAPFATAALGRILGERIGRKQNREWTARLMLQATVGRTAASATALSPDDLEALVGSVDYAYRLNGTFQMHGDTLMYLSKLKDGNGRPIYPECQGRAPTLLGYPVVPNPHMDSTLASGNRTVAFGDFARVAIRDVREVRVLMMQERYRDLDQVGMVAYQRSDMSLLDAGTGPVKYIAQP